MNVLAQLVANVVLGLIWWVLLFPVILLVATPFIFASAFFVRTPYWQAIAAYYEGVLDFWLDWGLQIFG